MKNQVIIGCLGVAIGFAIALASGWVPPERLSRAQDQRIPEARRAPGTGGNRVGSTGAPAPGAPTVSALPPMVEADDELQQRYAAIPENEFTPEERVNIAVYDRSNRSVVNITTKAVRPDTFFEVPTEGAGSGSVLDRNGHVLTNFHVIEGAQKIAVTLYNGESFEAGLVGQDPDNDMAVLRITAPPEILFPVAMGDSSQLRVGQRVFALGNPFGLERTLTIGTLSSLNRTLPSRTGRTMKSIIQIDAALNRGNSGGPLLDSRARLIGMNTAIASPSGGSTGVGFAIPVNTVKRVVPQLIANGRVIRPDTGISRVYETEKGLIVAAVQPGGPAERAGIRGFKIVKQKERRGPFVVEETRVDRREADMIIAVDGVPVRTADEFLDAIESKRPGENAHLHVTREGREVVIPVPLVAAE